MADFLSPGMHNTQILTMLREFLGQWLDSEIKKENWTRTVWGKIDLLCWCES
jgi:hypothetical protein